MSGHKKTSSVSNVQKKTNKEHSKVRNQYSSIMPSMPSGSQFHAQDFAGFSTSSNPSSQKQKSIIPEIDFTNKYVNKRALNFKSPAKKP